MKVNDTVVVIKRNPAGEETWRYSGRVLEVEGTRVRIEAPFNRPDLLFHGILMRQGDRFVEDYFSDRWYNIFEIHDVDSDEIKGWYCNVTRPAQFSPGQIDFVDLALDLLVYPDDRQLVLDEDEFKELHLPAELRAGALKALAELQWYFASRSDLI